ncbi:MAG: amino acid transporter [Actinobacteria bacterium]|nr:amino acid transporter [Actinomycetota bacterium]
MPEARGTLVPVPPALPVALTGFAAGLALIVAIGAQNAYVLRQGLRREHVGAVVAVCLAADVALIAAGTLGIGAVVERAPAVLVALRWAGAAYLAWFAVRSFRSAARPGELGASERSRNSVVLTAAGLTFLNPHVYLDTVVMLGSLANTHGALRWAFAGGAMVASAVWFTGLGFGARTLSGPLGRPTTWRALDVVIGFVMLGLAAYLALS